MKKNLVWIQSKSSEETFGYSLDIGRWNQSIFNQNEIGI